jgi:hypothetical protein
MAKTWYTIRWRVFWWGQGQLADDVHANVRSGDLTDAWHQALAHGCAEAVGMRNCSYDLVDGCSIHLRATKPFHLADYKADQRRNRIVELNVRVGPDGRRHYTEADPVEVDE